MKEIVMLAKPRIVSGLLLVLLTSCVDRGYVPDVNPPPKADAKVVDATGASVATPVMFDFTGTPVSVTLDGSASKDPNGKLAESSFRWRVTNAAGDMSIMAMGSKPVVMLGQGEWFATLWVTDNQKAIGTAATTKKITIGMAAMAMGGAGGASGGMGAAGMGAAGMGAAGMAASITAAECMAMVPAGPTDACKMCTCAIDSCRSMVIESACNAACWTFLGCLGSKCPNFVEMMAAGDTSCLTMNCLNEYVAYMPGPQGAPGAGACARMCPAECGGMPAM